MSTILGNPITLGGGGGKVPDYTYTGNAEWYNEEHTILKLKTSGVLTLTKDCIADVFCVGGGGSGGCLSSSSTYGGGGGGGFTRTARLQFYKGTDYPAVIGAGGASAYNSNGNDGGSTSINGVTANGGLKGEGKGGNGGSGGGASVMGSPYSSPYGEGGDDGGNGNNGGTGQGTTTRAFGEVDGEVFSGGGGGCSKSSSYTPLGGTGGGNGAAYSSKAATSGVDNTGGGGGGAYTVTGKQSGAGGSGVILIRFAS